MSDAPLVENECLESLVAEIADEFLERKRRGEQPDVADYVRRYPHAADVVREVLTTLQVLGLGRPEPVARADREKLPLGCLGDFRLLREVGRGGMGIVYEAEQISLGRRVALKVLPMAAALDERHLQRFKNEAQAAAQLQHQGIVPVYMFGCEGGVPFYAMQFIDGQSLAQLIGRLRHLVRPDEASGDAPSNIETFYAAEPEARSTAAHASADTGFALQTHVATEGMFASPGYFRTVARLGLQATDALEHAHGQGVVHRDVKPANLLVDGRGSLWITDFGLAHFKSDQRLTGTGDVLGTLRYMSPEQALGNTRLLDQSTDIYSLGATLYEMLTLEAPFPDTDREETLRRIAAEEPLPPRRRNKKVPADLETIVLKAMSKDPAERYMCRAMADDLRRFLDDRPILARRPTARQRAIRWARRHKSVVRAAGLVLVLAFVGLAMTTTLIWNAKQETEDALVTARKMRRLAEDAVNDMYTEVAESWLGNEPLSDPLQRKFLLKALSYYQEFARENGADPTVRRETARAYLRAGTIQCQLGQFAESESHFGEAARLFDRLAADFPGQREHLQELARVHNALAIVQMQTSQPREAEQNLRLARDLLERLAGSFPSDPAVQRDLARYHVNLAALLMNAGRFPEAETGYNRALALDTALAGLCPKVADYRHDLANTESNRGIMYWRMGRSDEAEKAWKNALEIARKLCSAHPRHRAYRKTLAECELCLFALHASARRFREAEPILIDALAARRKLAGDSPERVEYQMDLASALFNLGTVQKENGKLQQAEGTFEEAVTLLRKLSAAHPTVVQFQTLLASTYNNLGNLLKDTGRLPPAESAYHEALALLEKQPKTSWKQPGFRDELTIYLNNLAYLSWRLGRPKEAEPLFARAVRLREQLVADYPAIASYREKLSGTYVHWAWLLKKTQRLAEAEKKLRSAMTHDKRLASDFPDQPVWQRKLATHGQMLGWLLWEAGRFQEAKDAFQDSLSAWRQCLAAEPQNPTARHLLARFLADCPDTTIRNVAEAVQLAETAVKQGGPSRGEAWITLGLAHYRAGQWQATLQALEKAANVDPEEACLRDFLQALAHRQLRDSALAQQSYDQALNGLRSQWLMHDELERWRAEADKLLRPQS
jgi:serine/threonine protein kinase/tetratricopeptide (TPR) repeat protein